MGRPAFEIEMIFPKQIVALIALIHKSFMGSHYLIIIVNNLL